MISTILLMVRRSLRQHFFSAFVTILSVALAAGLVMSVFAINKQTRDAFTGGPAGFDAVLGARGSQLQLVLNSVFHLETSPGNIPWSLYEAAQKARGVELAVPYAVGDNYKGFRIVGTTSAMFSDFEYQKGRKFEFRDGGRPFDEKRREAVMGSFAAEKTGLKIGDTFQPVHGLTETKGSHTHPESYVVTGIMRPTNSPNDRVIWIPLEGIFRMEGHVLRGSDPKGYKAEAGTEIPDEHKEISAVMLKFRGFLYGKSLEQQINQQGKVATLAWPIAAVMGDLFEKIGWVNRILELVAYLVVVVAAASILASIYNTINERRREFAILRALGARRRLVFSAIIAESATIAALGSILGFVVYGLILGGAAVIIRARTGVVLDLTALHPVLWAAPLAITALGAVAGLLPAFKAYRTDVAENLSPAT